MNPGTMKAGKNKIGFKEINSRLKEWNVQCGTDRSRFRFTFPFFIMRTENL